MGSGTVLVPNLMSSMPTASLLAGVPAEYAILVIEAPTSVKPKKRVPPETSPAGMLSIVVPPPEYPMVIVCPLSCQPVQYAPSESIGVAKVRSAPLLRYTLIGLCCVTV